MAPFPDELSSVTGEQVAAVFEAREPLTVGIEDELMLLDPTTFDLSPSAGEVLARLNGDPRFKHERPISQIELTTEPTVDATKAVAALAAGRRDLAEAARGVAVPVALGVHPFAAPAGELAPRERYRLQHERYGWLVRRQLTAALQVHVAVGGAARTLAVYNALRGYLPEIAALAANAPFYCGEDTGLASVRPTIAQLLPRQGVPPAIASWDEFAAELRWGAAHGAVSEPRLWWWELRPHALYGTLEMRVPDVQTTVADAAGVVATIQALVAWLAERHDAGESLPAAIPTWRIAENRFLALRDGIEGSLADLETGELEPTRERLHRLIESLEPVCDRLGTTALLSDARALADSNGAMRQRELARSEGVRGMIAALSERLAEPPAGGTGATAPPERLSPDRRGSARTASR